MALVIKKTGFEEYLNPDGKAWLRALIMGDPGAGKTRSAAFWPKPIFAKCEDGLLSVADLGVPYAEIKASRDMTELLNHVDRDSRLPNDRRQYLTFVLDAVDSYQRSLIFERLRGEQKEALSGYADWGFLDQKMTALIERLSNLNMNVVVILHTKEDRVDEGEDSILVRKARLKGDIKDAIFQDFDLIGQMETYYQAEKGVRTLKRHIRWQPEPRYPMLRDRSGKLPRFTEVDFTDQDYWRIFNAITDGLDALPRGEDVETVGTPDAEPVADAKGGPVDVPEEATAKKGARKAPAKKAAAKKAAPPEPKPEPKAEEPESDDTPMALTKVKDPEPAADAVATDAPSEEPPAESTSDASTDVQADQATEAVGDPAEQPEPEQQMEAATELVSSELGGEVEGEEPGGTEAPSDVPEEQRCGFQPSSHSNFPRGHDGCGRDLRGENTAKVNLALLRAKVRLCSSCLDEWRAANAS